ncbi:MAG: ribonuclease D [Candidatus Polarisedimenticolaceae bacterium]|nr:ribonuclease D [Candidatus Polarisedimenticolaceae bacterium]
MQEHFVDSPEQLKQLCERLQQSQWLALDTEFIRERTYFPHFCLLQISNGQEAACIDPLSLEDLSPLTALLFDENIVKVFHAGRQDMEIFYQHWQRLPSPLFDTQVAASLLGQGDQIGYGGLVQKVLGIELEKGASRTDWSQRPLEQEQVRYALDDVIHLGDVYLQQRAALEKMERLQWLDDDFNMLTDPTTYQNAPESCWQRVKGRQHLKGVQMAVLQQLAAWREERAIKRNIPRKWMVKDEILLEMARRMPSDKAQLLKLRGVEDRLVERHGEDLLQLIKKARALPKDEWPVEKRAKRPGLEQEALTDLLMCALRLLSQQQKITPVIIAGRKELERLAKGERDIALLSGWRKSVAGDVLLDLAEGRCQIEVEKGVPRIVRAGSL